MHFVRWFYSWKQKSDGIKSLIRGYEKKNIQAAGEGENRLWASQ